MKQFSFLLLLLIVANACTDNSQDTISKPEDDTNVPFYNSRKDTLETPGIGVYTLTTSAKLRAKPNLTSEAFVFDAGTQVIYTGNHSEKEEIIKVGKDSTAHYWMEVYLPQLPRSGWIYGGCLKKGGDLAFFQKIKTEKGLSGSMITGLPCKEDKNNCEPECGTDCGENQIIFLNDSTLIDINICMDSDDYGVGKYRIVDDVLYILYQKGFDEESDPDSSEVTQTDVEAFNVVSMYYLSKCFSTNEPTLSSPYVGVDPTYYGLFKRGDTFEERLNQLRKAGILKKLGVE